MALLVGAYALAAHGYPRATMDIDIWVMPAPDNAPAVLRALRRFGTPLHNLTQADLERENTVFQIGVAPPRISGGRVREHARGTDGRFIRLMAGAERRTKADGNPRRRWRGAQRPRHRQG